MADRRRWSEDERSALLAAHADSGMSMWAFAREAGVPYTTFLHWKKRRRVTRFVPVEIERRVDAKIDVIVGNVVVRVGADFDDALLVRVVRTLSAC